VRRAAAALRRGVEEREEDEGVEEREEDEGVEDMEKDESALACRGVCSL
jgi:hypothetical protein